MAMFRILKPSGVIQTTNDDPTNILVFDGSLEDFFGTGINNWQKWNIEIIAQDSILDGYSGNMASWRFEFSAKADLGMVIIDTYPLVPAYYESDAGASTWDINITLSGPNIIFTVIGEVDRHITWYLYGSTICVSDEPEPI